MLILQKTATMFVTLLHRYSERPSIASEGLGVLSPHVQGI